MFDYDNSSADIFDQMLLLYGKQTRKKGLNSVVFLFVYSVVKTV